jgi:cytoskeletal protein CcmA (bactofilin family)
MLNRGESRNDFVHTPEAAGRTASDRVPEPTAVLAAQLGRSVVVKGELSGSEDLTIDGRVEGVINLAEHALTIGPNATIAAEINAKTVTIFGSVVGNVIVTGTLHLRHGGSLEGDVVCGAIVVQDRANFCGRVDMPERRAAETDQELTRSAVA